MSVANSHFNLDTKNTLTEHDVPDGVVNEVEGGLTGVNHEAVGELHGLGTGSTKLAGDDNLATLGTRLNNEAEDTIASPEIEDEGSIVETLAGGTYLRTARPPRSL